MPTAQDITDTIEDRIREANAQIASLQAARSVLTDTDTPQVPDAAPAVAATAPAPAPAAAPATRKRTSARHRRSGNLAAGQLEELLEGSENGLSLVALTALVEVSDAKIRERLHELERRGQVRNSGARRTSLWRLVTDEERIAERTAELKRAPSRS